MFNEHDKLIFRYFDGTKDVWGDPITIRRKLYGMVPNMGEVLKMCRSDDPVEKDQGLEQLLPAIRYAFDMPCNPKAEKPEDYGATEDNCVKAVKDFMTFVKKNAPNTENSPTASASTASPILEHSATTPS
jgi:hypothetical protein